MNKKFGGKTIAVLRTMILVIIAMVLSVTKVSAEDTLDPSATTMTKENWINLVNAYTSGKDASQNGHFYNAVPFNANGTGDLSWQTASAGAAVWNGIEAPNCPSSGTTYSPVNPGQLLFALNEIAKNSDVTNSYTIEIEKDMDMNGKNGALWPYGITLKSHVTINGNNHTIYNLFMCNDVSSTPTGLVSYAYAMTVKDLNFCGANILGKGGAGEGAHSGPTGVLLGKAADTTDTLATPGEMIFNNVEITDALVVGRGSDNGLLFGRNTDTIGNGERIIEDCHSARTVTLGGYHVASLMGPLSMIKTSSKEQYVNRCYAIDAVVVSYNGHSGGLISCMSGGNYTVSNCFVDAQVYGNETTGVFTGMIVGAGESCPIFSSCFASGFIEGKNGIGGFIGSYGNASSGPVYMNCYSTALVGMNNGGSYMGGFVGKSGNCSKFSNCYAAGEVGSADTSVVDATLGGTQTQTVGGFAGTTRDLSNNIFANCYYDKQTTAMREYDVADRVMAYNKVPQRPASVNNTTFAIKDEQGLRGVLTTSTTKSGGGLTSDGTAATVSISVTGGTVESGFTGFRDDSGIINGMTSNISDKCKENATAGYGGTNTCWDTSAGDSYPELKAFKNNLAGFDAADAEVANAYSKSSTSTVQLETWENGLKADTGQKDGTDLPATTYDTVRDITSRFNLTREGADTWTTLGTQDGADGTHATTTICEEESNVLALNDDGMSWYCDSFVPGNAEWLKVYTSSEDKQSHATRRLRVFPTAGIEAGPSENIYQSSNPTAESKLYDHADKVAFYFSTAQRMAAEPNDVTSGIYPDISGTVGGNTANSLTDQQKRLVKQRYSSDISESDINTFLGTDNDSYGSEDTWSGLDMSYMARSSDTQLDGTPNDNNAKGSKVYTYIREITGFDEDEHNKIETGATPLDCSKGNDLGNKFNGYEIFSAENRQYLVEYVWQLQDGRLLRDAKIITVKAMPFDATIETYESGGLDHLNEPEEILKYIDSDDSKVGMEIGVTEVGENGIVTSSGLKTWEDLTSKTEKDDGKPDFGDKVVASWKVTNPLKQVKKVKVEFAFQPTGNDSTPQYFSSTLINPKNGDIVTIPYTFWRIVTLEDGEYYSIPETLTRKYTVGQSGDYYYLYLNKDNESSGVPGENQMLTMTDAEDEIHVYIELSETLILSKKVTGYGADKDKLFAFDVYYNDGAAESETPGSYSYQIWNDNETVDDYSDDTMVTKEITGRPNSGTFDAQRTTETKAFTTKLSSDEYIVVMGASAGDQYRVQESTSNNGDYQASYVKGSGSIVIEEDAKSWMEFGEKGTKEDNFDTGTLTLPTIEKTTDTETDNSISRIQFTNDYLLVKVEGTKTWEDNNNQDGIRPSNVTLQVSANGIELNPQPTPVWSEMNTDKWKYSYQILNLPKYDEDGKEIVYTVAEINPEDGYTPTYNGFDITNTHTPETISIPVEKIWADDPEDVRPDSVQIQLYKQVGTAMREAVDGKVLTLSPADANAENSDIWEGVFTNIPKYENGELVNYSVKEETIPSDNQEGNNDYYQVSYGGNAEDGFTVTNTHHVDRMTVGVEKIWEDDNDRDRLRPEELEVTLYQSIEGEEPTPTEHKIQLTEENNWSGTFENLPKTDNGESVVYTVKEEAVNGYEEGLIEGDMMQSFTITNIYIPETTSYSGTKIWNDDNNQDGLRPDTITVLLYKNDELMAPQPDVTWTQKDDNTWEYSFDELYKKENGEDITYSVKEEFVDYYTTTYGGSKITNTHEVKTVDIPVEKKWNDENDKWKQRPQNVTIQLMKSVDGESPQEMEGQSITLEASDEWKGTFEKLPCYEAGKAITYTVLETSLTEGYTSRITGNMEEGFVVTNTFAAPIIHMDKVCNTNEIKTGQKLTYTITVSNKGNADAYGVWIKDLVPDNTTYVSCSDNGTTDDNKTYVSWFLNPLKAGDSKEVQLVVEVKDCANGTEILNTAMWELRNEVPDDLTMNPNGGVSPTPKTVVKGKTNSSQTEAVNNDPSHDSSRDSSRKGAQTGDFGYTQIFILILLISGVIMIGAYRRRN